LYVAGTEAELNQFKQNSQSFYDGLDDTQKSFFPKTTSAPRHPASGAYTEQYIENGEVVIESGTHMMGVWVSLEHEDEYSRNVSVFGANMKRFEDSLTPEQLAEWNELKARSGTFAEPLSKPDDGIAPAPDVYVEPFTGLYGREPMPDIDFPDTETPAPKSAEPAQDEPAILSRADEIDNAREYIRDLDPQEVKAIQRLVGVDDDGMWGQKTMAAVKDYMAKNDIPEDSTFAQLREDLSEQIATQYAIGAAKLDENHLAGNFTGATGEILRDPSFAPELDDLQNGGINNRNLATLGV
jgi:hypothetical protein